MSLAFGGADTEQRADSHADRSDLSAVEAAHVSWLKLKLRSYSESSSLRSLVTYELHRYFVQLSATVANHSFERSLRSPVHAYPNPREWPPLRLDSPHWMSKDTEKRSLESLSTNESSKVVDQGKPFFPLLLAAYRRTLLQYSTATVVVASGE